MDVNMASKEQLIQETRNNNIDPEVQEYALEWARWATELDQKPREMIRQVVEMGFKTDAKFYNKDRNEMEEIEIVAHSLFLESLALSKKNQKELQTALKEFIQKIGEFPGIKNFGIDVLVATWLIYQHSDNDRNLQKEGLLKMYETRKKDRENISLVYFYYLTDRITMGLYGYQFFGTQSNGNNLICLPEPIKANFKNNPSLFCTKLVESKLSQNSQEPAHKDDVLWLWQLADSDKITTEGQDCIVESFIEKYS